MLSSWRTSRARPLRSFLTRLSSASINRKWPAIRAADPAIRSSNAVASACFEVQQIPAAFVAGWRWLLPLPEDPPGQIDLLEASLLSDPAPAMPKPRWPSHQPGRQRGKGEKQLQTHPARGPPGVADDATNGHGGEPWLNSFAPEFCRWRLARIAHWAIGLPPLKMRATSDFPGYETDAKYRAIGLGPRQYVSDRRRAAPQPRCESASDDGTEIEPLYWGPCASAWFAPHRHGHSHLWVVLPTFCAKPTPPPPDRCVWSRATPATPQQAAEPVGRGIEPRQRRLNSRGDDYFSVRGEF